MAVREQEVTKTGLVLDSLEVKNFRAFKHLTIEKLGRVNLITGKNAVGKTTLLEALFFYAHGGYPHWIRIFLGLRNELSLPNQPLNRLDQRQFKFNLDDINELRNVAYLFNGRHGVDFPLEPIVLTDLTGHSDTVNVSLEWLVEEKASDQEIARSPQYKKVSPIERLEYVGAEPYITVEIGAYFHAHYRLDQVMLGDTRSWIAPRAFPSQFLLISTSTDSELAKQWDAIASSELEDEVVRSLQLIHTGVETVRFIADPQKAGDRVAVVRLKGIEGRIPLKTLGDGLNRLLSITLSLVNSQNGFCLLDEIDTGIHYSVQPAVWSFIFELAHRLNVQVFATTHSWDCIEAFQQAASNSPESGILVKLREFDGDVQAVTFDEDELEVITRQQIEVR